jgi:hypothetical protein
MKKQIQGTQKLRIYYLEDANLSTVRVKNVLEETFPGVEVWRFRTRLELEKTWQEGNYPDALILDLLVPEVRIFLARILLSRRLFYRTLRLFIWLWIKKKVPDYLIQLQGDLIDGRDTHWGGVEFLRSRAYLKDQSKIPFYIYSLAANEKFTDEDKTFGPICKIVMGFIYGKIEKDLNISIFAKGYYSDNKLVNDHFQDLLEQLKEQLDSSRSFIKPFIKEDERNDHV